MIFVVLEMKIPCEEEARPGHSSSLFTKLNSGKNWKCPGLVNNSS